LDKPHKILVIGLDGATFDLMLPWIDEGLLPHLGGLMEGGSWSRLESTTPPITPCAWSSFMTGMNPGKHGLFDFVEPIEGEHGFQFTNASSRRAPSLWKLLSEQDRKVGVVNVPMTYPPEPVNGYLLSGLDTPHEQSSYSYPAELRAELRAKGIPYRVDLRHLGDMRTDKLRDRRLADMHEMETIRTKAVKHLRETMPADFNMVVYIASDQVQHHFWHYMDESHDKYDAAGAKKYGNAIRDTYIHLDSLIGELLEDVDDDTVVMIMSDHGFGPVKNTRLRLNQLLAEEGMLSFAAESKTGKRFRAVAGTFEKALKATLTPGMKAKLANLFPKLRVSVESADSAQVDWSRTTACANEVYRMSPAVWLNRKDRTTDGTLKSDEEINSALDHAERVLGELEDPTTGERVISQVLQTRNIYHGPFTSHAPDLLVSWWLDGFLLEKSSADTSSPIVEHCEKSVIGGVEFAGGHKLDGVFMMCGGPTRVGNAFEGANIVDVAPTILYLMGLPIPQDMDGKVLVDAIDPDYVSRHMPEYGENVLNGGDQEPPQKTMSADDEKLVAERLQALGYLD